MIVIVVLIWWWLVCCSLFLFSSFRFSLLLNAVESSAHFYTGLFVAFLCSGCLYLSAACATSVAGHVSWLLTAAWLAFSSPPGLEHCCSPIHVETCHLLEGVCAWCLWTHVVCVHDVCVVSMTVCICDVCVWCIVVYVCEGSRCTSPAAMALPSHLASPWLFSWMKSRNEDRTHLVNYCCRGEMNCVPLV